MRVRPGVMFSQVGPLQEGDGSAPFQTCGATSIMSGDVHIPHVDARWCRLLTALTCLLVLAWPTTSSAAAPKLGAMILDGESSVWHDWKAATPMLRQMLEQTGLFQVDVLTAPAAEGELSTFAPDFSRYAVVVFNYDAPDGRWPSAVQLAFERYVSQGGGVVLVHAANNAFPRWRAFNEMAGVGGWRDRNQSAGVRGGSSTPPSATMRRHWPRWISWSRSSGARNGLLQAM